MNMTLTQNTIPSSLRAGNIELPLGRVDIKGNIDGTGVVSPLLDTITAGGQNHVVAVLGGTAKAALPAAPVIVVEGVQMPAWVEHASGARDPLVIGARLHERSAGGFRPVGEPPPNSGTIWKE